MKYIHIPTLLLHAGLLLLAKLTINNYHDAFLVVGILVLILHAVWAARSKRILAVSHTLGCVAQAIAFFAGLIEVHSGAFGLGGGEFALLFYGITLAVSFVIECIIGALKWKA